MTDRKSLAQDLGENIKRIRAAKGITRKDLSEKLGVGVDTIGLYENGKTLPPLDKIFEIADLFQVSVISLTGDNKFNPAYPSVEEKIMEYRFNRANEILRSADCEVQKTDRESYTVKFELNFMKSESEQSYSIVPKTIEIKLENADTLVKMVERTEKDVTTSGTRSYIFRDFFNQVCKGATTDDLAYRIIADIK